MWSRRAFRALVQPPIVGMVHLPALPGSPGWAGDWQRVRRAVLAEVQALVSGGLQAAMVENYHDVPFHPAEVPPATIASMAVLVAEIRREFPDLLLGVNVLRNDAEAALAIADASGARFIRVNVHIGAAVTDQGLVTGQAHRTLRLRRELAPGVAIMADLQVKHARPLVERPLEEEGSDLRGRGLADAIIVTGAATGQPADPRQLARLRSVLPDCPLLVGSGVTADNIAAFWPAADGFIVGTALQRGGSGGQVQPAAVARLVTCLERLQAEPSTADRKDPE